MSRTLLASAVTALLLVGLAPLDAAQERGVEAMESGPGQVRPLSEILALARRIVPGRVIDVELEYDVDLDDSEPQGRWVYEIEVLTTENKVVEMEFDARTGQLLEIDGAPWPADIPRESP